MKKLLRDYFTRENVVAVLGLLFMASCFFFNKISNTQEEIVTKYKASIKNVSNELKELNSENEFLIFNKENDSVNLIRTTEINSIYMQLSKGNKIENISSQIFDLKNRNLQASAKLAKFENMLLGKRANERYKTEVQRLKVEHDFLQILDKYCVAMKANDNAEKNKLNAELQDSFLELYAVHTKDTEKTKYFIKQIDFSKIGSEKITKEFIKEMEDLVAVRKKYELAFTISVSILVSVFCLSLFLGTFRKT